MIESFLDPTFGGSVTAWATNLTAEINSGKFKSDAAGWISCSSITETQSSSKKRGLLRSRSLAEEIKAVTEARSVEAALPELECPLTWAQEANAFDCVRTKLRLMARLKHHLILFSFNYADGRVRLQHWRGPMRGHVLRQRHPYRKSRAAPFSAVY